MPGAGSPDRYRGATCSSQARLYKAPTASLTFRSRTTKNRHRCIFPPLGAQTPASRIFRISSFGTGSGFIRRIDRVVRMISNTSAVFANSSGMISSRLLASAYVHRFDVRRTVPFRSLMGLVAFLVLMSAEACMAHTVAGTSTACFAGRRARVLPLEFARHFTGSIFLGRKRGGTSERDRQRDDEACPRHRPLMPNDPTE